MQPIAIVLLSGGLDSATVAAQAIVDGYTVIPLSLNYGQRHARELLAAKQLAAHFGIHEHFVLDVNLAQWGGSALTDEAVAVTLTGVQSNIIQLKHIAQVEHSRDRAPLNGCVNILDGLLASCQQPQKPLIAIDHSLLLPA